MTGAADADPAGIGKPLGNEVLRPGDDIVQFPAPAVFNVQITELLAIAAAAAIVRLKDQISLLRQIGGLLANAQKTTLVVNFTIA